MERGPEEFLAGFVLPLIVGGELHVSRPLDAEDLQHVIVQATTGSRAAGDALVARQRLVRELWLYPLDPILDEHEVEILVGLHNLLFLSHPDAAGWRVRDARLHAVTEFTARCLQRPPRPITETQVVARHTLLGHVPALVRTDSEVRYWAGRRTFRGMEPPARLLRWRAVRAVRERREDVSWLGTELSAQQLELTRLLLLQTPLTDLLAPARPAPPFSWWPIEPLLAHRGLCRLSAHLLLEQGLSQVGPPLARAFWQMASDGTTLTPNERRAALGRVAGLVLYLYATAALSAENDDPVREPADAAGSLTSILAAAAALGWLPRAELLGSTELAERLARWARIAAEQLGAPAQELASRLGVTLAE